jgi:arylsulfatase
MTVPEDGAEGVLIANAGFIGGWALWIDGTGHLNHSYSWLGVESYRQTSTEPIPTGDITVKMLFEIDEPKPGAGGKVTLWANDEQIGEGRLEHTIPIIATSGGELGQDAFLSPSRPVRSSATRLPSVTAKTCFCGCGRSVP